MASKTKNFVDVPIFQLLQWKYALKLEIAGLRHSHGSVYAHVKRTLGWKGGRQAILDRLSKELAQLTNVNKEQVH